MPKITSKSKKSVAKEEPEVYASDHVEEEDEYEVEEEEEVNIKPAKKSSKKEPKEPKESKKSKKSEPVQVVQPVTQECSNWGEMDDDVSVEELVSNMNKNAQYDDDSEEDEKQKKPTNTFRLDKQKRESHPKSVRFANSATNFSYQTYTDLDTPVDKLSNKDLVKILIVRAYAESQHDFCKTMKTVLRAMNLECPMPGTRPMIESNQQYQQQHQQQHQQQQYQQVQQNQSSQSQLPPRRPQSANRSFQRSESRPRQSNRMGDIHDF